MPEQTWTTLRETGLCHLVVVEADPGAAGPPAAGAQAASANNALDLRSLLELACTLGDYAIDTAGGSTCIAFTSFSDMERVTGALRGVRPVRQLEPHWSSQWDGVYDKEAARRLRGDLRWQKRPAARPTLRSPAEAGSETPS